MKPVCVTPDHASDILWIYNAFDDAGASDKLIDQVYTTPH
jgi:hypothetical protein